MAGRERCQCPECRQHRSRKAMALVASARPAAQQDTVSAIVAAAVARGPIDSTALARMRAELRADPARMAAAGAARARRRELNAVADARAAFAAIEPRQPRR